MAKKFNYKDKIWETTSKKKYEPVITPLIASQYQQPFDNELSQAEAERLAILAEEAAEVIQMVGKILRNGYAPYSPENQNNSNRAQLERKMGGLLNIVSAMWYNEDINEVKTLQKMQDTADTWLRYTHHQGL